MRAGGTQGSEAMLAQDLCSPALQKSHRASGRGLPEVTCRKEAFNFNGNSNDDSLCKYVHERGKETDRGKGERI